MPHGPPRQCRDERHAGGDAGGRAVLGYRPFGVMDMYIAVFIEFRVDAELRGAAADKADRRAGGFLHHVTQIARKLKLA